MAERARRSRGEISAQANRLVGREPADGTARGASEAMPGRSRLRLALYRRESCPEPSLVLDGGLRQSRQVPPSRPTAGGRGNTPATLVPWFPFVRPARRCNAP